MAVSRVIRASAVVYLALSAQLLLAQHRVDPRNLHERLITVVKLTGKGTYDDPIRPMYAPLPSQVDTRAKSAIISFHYVLSDDGKYALVEFMARDRSAFAPILADQSLKCFIKDKDTQTDVELELKKYKKDFDFNTFVAGVSR